MKVEPRCATKEEIASIKKESDNEASEIDRLYNSGKFSAKELTARSRVVMKTVILLSHIAFFESLVKNLDGWLVETLESGQMPKDLMEYAMAARILMKGES